MAFQWKYLRDFAGLNSKQKHRKIGDNQFTKLQNMTASERGNLVCVGGMETHGEVPTQAALICPGSGLFHYGSDHWLGGSETVVDLLPNNNAVSDNQTEANAVTGWTASGDGAIASAADGDSGIASNGTSYIIKITNDATPGITYVEASATTVVGRRYKISADLYNYDGSSIDMRVSSVSQENELYSSEKYTTAAWDNHPGEFIATATTTYVNVVFVGDNTEKAYFDDVYLTVAPRRDLDTNWLALADVATAHVDLYNVNDDSFTADLLDFGIVNSYTGGATDIDFPTTDTITDADSEFLNRGIAAGKTYTISGCTTTTVNNVIFVCKHVSNAGGTITAEGNPFTVTAAEAGTVTLTEYNPTAFHFINDGLRASPAGGGIALRPKHYSFVDRYHLKGSESSEDPYRNWYANDVGPTKPTDVAFDAAVDAGVSGNLTVGAGWEVGMTVTAGGGSWPAGTYILACSDIYDDGQESALYVPSTDVAMTAITEGASLTLCAKATGPYDERISGGRAYTRLDETDDPWILLLDISMADGARTNLSGNYNAWAKGTTADTAYMASFVSKAPNLDTYESLTGTDPGIKIEAFGSDNRFWDTSVIAGNRCFIGSPRYDDEGGKTSHYRDRILYSKVNQFDVFPIDNYIDVVGSDAEDYVKLFAWGSEILAFKSRTLYIVDISDPDPAGWQLKQDKNKGKYPFKGIENPAAVFETPYGPAWVNEWGIFLYAGGEIVNLLGDKIEASDFPLAYQRYYELDGTDDYLSIANSASLNHAAGDGTIIIEFTPNDVSTDLAIIDRYVDANNYLQAYWTQSNSRMNLYYRIGGSNVQGVVAQSISLVANTPYHMALSFVNGGANIFRINNDTNPSILADYTTGGTLSPSADLWIGRKSSPSLYDDIEIWRVVFLDTALSSSQITDDYNGTPPPSGNIMLELKPKSIGDATWTDTSGNSLNATVLGATAIYEDSWKKFYTKFSQVGYHAKTNKLIVMRSYIGNLYSGQNYGDAWMVDLDTNEHMTARRVFTAGAHYTNFVTDWNGDLIVGRQSSTNVITEKWTDEPQSQAIGLIDVRTKDFDFGNPAIAKIIDAIVLYYKSSAAQTTPVSYAIDGDDRQTAWTRLTGNFAAEGNLEKLTLEPTPFECDTIRLKVDNPTAAGTMEIADIGIRYQTEEEDID